MTPRPGSLLQSSKSHVVKPPVCSCNDSKAWLSSAILSDAPAIRRPLIARLRVRLRPRRGRGSIQPAIRRPLIARLRVSWQYRVFAMLKTLLRLKAQNRILVRCLSVLSAYTDKLGCYTRYHGRDGAGPGAQGREKSSSFPLELLQAV